MKKSQWRKKGKGASYVGTYERDAKGERVFILTKSVGGNRRITFESHQAARKQGWEK